MLIPVADAISKIDALYEHSELALESAYKTGGKTYYLARFRRCDV
jgi:hypothetical protein